ncbi:glycosyltransferase [Crossiella cryophila]|uniref:UDP:flavonoid glycosyltransferase YjiC (YdhE family) n=1 Tax=Crossiella cryophila TaxID=43355 RepID=A0A7W7CHH4_9PSEU|nr:glycosyltransferase [Crossiella cryophila]MBB4681357.1 UDP:flavonoid glycosyltransferase YjiC (YdhE family) [Crossiella cryophila]
MRIAIVTAGSRGDTAPYVGLGSRLQAAGHEVSLAAQRLYEPMIRAAGLGFREMPGNIREDFATGAGQDFQRHGTGLRALPAQIRFAGKMISDLGQGTQQAIEGAELVLTHRAAFGYAYWAAKAAGVPSLGLELFPSGIVPSGDFPPVSLAGRTLGHRGNLAGHALMRGIALASSPLLPGYKQYLRGLGVRDVGELYTDVRRGRWPVLHGWSPQVLPRPADWPAAAEVVGYWWPWQSPDYRPPAELAEFLAAGEPPVFLSFGSMAVGRAEELSALAVEAMRLAGVRGVIQAGWNELSATGEHVLAIGDVPHEWLFPRMAAVVHHGGAGTTGAGVRAGVPAVVVPVLGDQPMWAARLAELGVSPGAIPMKKINAPQLATLIKAAARGPGYHRRARTLADRVTQEDGAARVIEAVARLGARA